MSKKEIKEIYILAVTQFIYENHNGHIILGQPVMSYPFFFTDYDYAYAIYEDVVKFHEINEFSIQEHLTRINSKGALAIHPKYKNAPAISIELYPQPVNPDISELYKAFGAKEVEVDPIDDIMKSVGIDPEDNTMDEEYQNKIKAKSSNLLSIEDMRKIIEERNKKKK